MKNKLLSIIIMLSRYFIYISAIHFISFTFLFAGNGVSQPESNVNVWKCYLSANKKNITVREAFEFIEKNTEYRFAYDETITDRINVRVNLFGTNKSVADYLLEISKRAKLRFKQVNKAITVKKIEKDDIFINPIEITRDGINVTGKVVSGEDNEGLPGVNVIVKGTSQGTVTDVDGNYSLKVPDQNSMLVFSSVGYVQEEIVIGTKTSIDITLIPDITALEEIVVIGYGTQKKVSLTGSVANIKAKELEAFPSSNLSALLAGRMSGVYVSSNTGTPGVSSSVQIRSQGSWNKSNPVFVIDGIVRDKRVFDALDPMEIQDISVLKDAASAAIYGSRSDGGVILVTTKTGNAGRPEITFSSSLSLEKPTKLPEMMSGVDIANMGRSYLEPTHWARWSDQEIDWLKTVNGGYGYDYLEEVYRDPTTNRHTLNVSGGNDRVTYFIGGSYYGQTGFVDNLSYNKYNVRASITANITDNLTAYINLSNINTKRNKFYWQYDNNRDDLPNLWSKMLTWQFYEPVYYQGKPPNTGWLGNIGELISNRSGYWKKREHTQDAVMALEYKVPFIKGLSLKGTYSYENYNSERKTFAKKHVLYDIIRPTRVWKDVVYTGTTSLSNGPSEEFIEISDDAARSYQLNFQASYKRAFGNHNIDAVLVYEQFESFYSNILGKRKNFPILTKDQIFATNSDNINSSLAGDEFETGRLSYIGRLNYDYNLKYLLSVSLRYDGSMNFSPDNRWGLFPSVSGAWRISEEPFFSSSLVNDLKIRASVGLLGNDAVGGWQWQERYSATPGFYFGTTPVSHSGITFGGIVNENITWEKSMTYNAGFDASLFNSLRVTGDYWFKSTYDILGGRVLSLPTTFGGNMPDENYGEVHSNGYELELSYDNSIGNKINYYVKGNFTYATNEVIKKDVATNIQDWQDPIGRPLGYIVGYRAEDIIRTQADLDAIPDGWTLWGKTPQMGMLNYRDISGSGGVPDGKIDKYDQDVLCDYSIPPITYGFVFGGDWKGFSIEAFFQGVAGAKKYYTGSLKDPYPWTRVSAIWNDYWSPDNPNASMPLPHFEWYDQQFSNSTFWLKKSDFIRLRYLNIGYTLPAKLINKAGINRAKVFFSGTNLFYLTNQFKAYDPEINSFNSYPNMKNFSIGLTITL
ncbi:MAG: TonB-dependent receptor [Cytophagales bacterium]|nr:TonB-dependent receptor [Cytophagales bacterium]